MSLCSPFQANRSEMPQSGLSISGQVPIGVPMKKVFLLLTTCMMFPAHASLNLHYLPGDAFFATTLSSQLLQQLKSGQFLFPYHLHGSGNDDCAPLGFSHLQLSHLSEQSISSMEQAWFLIRQHYADLYPLNQDPEPHIPMLIYNADHPVTSLPLAVAFNQESQALQHSLGIATPWVHRFGGEKTHQAFADQISALRVSGPLALLGQQFNPQMPLLMPANEVVFVILMESDPGNYSVKTDLPYFVISQRLRQYAGSDELQLGSFPNQPRAHKRQGMDAYLERAASLFPEELDPEQLDFFFGKRNGYDVAWFLRILRTSGNEEVHQTMTRYMQSLFGEYLPQGAWFGRWGRRSATPAAEAVLQDVLNQKKALQQARAKHFMNARGFTPTTLTLLTLMMITVCGLFVFFVQRRKPSW